MKPHSRVAFLPLVHFRLITKRPRPYAENPQSLGEHLRKRRLERCLTLKAAGKLLGVTDSTLINSEQGKTKPRTPYLGRIIAFLGYDPFPQPETLRERLLRERRIRGWTIPGAARHLGVDPSTWSDWERGGVILYRRHRVRVANFLGLDPDAFSADMSGRWKRGHGTGVDGTTRQTQGAMVLERWCPAVARPVIQYRQLTALVWRGRNEPTDGGYSEEV